MTLIRTAVRFTFRIFMIAVIATIAASVTIYLVIAGLASVFS